MPALSPADAAILRQHPLTVKRYLSVCPRTPVFQAQTPASAWSFDGNTGGIYQIAYANVTLGSYGNIQPGMTLDIGTTPGGFDVAKLRIRAAATASVLKVAETAQGALALPMSSGYYLTVRDERRLWPKLPMLTTAKSTGKKYYDTFDFKVDYDVPYTDETNHFPPLAVIEGRPAGWVDSGQSYRTVTLDGSRSAAVAKSATLSTYAWNLGDGSFAAGTGASDAVIVATFPAGFRHVSLTVTDSNGTSSTRYFPVWSHDDSYPPLTDFVVERDETEQGREMDFTLFGEVDCARESVIPEGTLFCYWSEVILAEEAAPAQFRAQCLGWAVRDTTRFKLDRSQYFVSMAGPHYWLNLQGNAALSWLRRSTPSEWYHMADCTDDRAIATLLRYFSTALDVCNLYLSDVTHEWGQPDSSDYAAIKVDKGSLWQQIAALTAEYSGQAGCDSLHGIWLRRLPSIMPVDFSPNRENVDSVLTLIPADWPDDDAPEFAHEFLQTVGQVKLGGAAWISGAADLKAAVAPGEAPGYGAQDESIPDQVLTASSTALAGTMLNQIAGNWWAWLNNPRKDLTLSLLAALDVVEPAWLEWITLDVSQANVRGLEVDQVRFIVSRVSIQHSNEPGQPPYRVNWTISQETEGQPGRSVTIPVSETVSTDYTDPDDLYPGDADGSLDEINLEHLLPGAPNIIMSPNTDGRLYFTDNFNSSSPTWTRTNPSLSGDVIDFVVDAFSPGYLKTGTAINGWITTNTKIYRLTDIFGTCIATLQHTYAGAPAGVYRTIQSQWAVPNWVMVVSHYNNGTGTTCTYTTDGVNWTEVTITPYYFSGKTAVPSLWMSSRTPGLARTGAFQSPGGSGSARLYETTNYGATWTLVSTPSVNFNDDLGGTYLVPYHDNANQLMCYWNYRENQALFNDHKLYRTASDGATMANVTPGPADELGPRWYKQLSDCAINRLRMCGVFMDPDSSRYSVWVTSTGGDSWGSADLEGLYPDYSSTYLRPFVPGDNTNLIYLLGSSGAIGFVDDFATIQDKRGNIVGMTNPTPGQFVGICGGLS